MAASKAMKHRYPSIQGLAFLSGPGRKTREEPPFRYPPLPFSLPPHPHTLLSHPGQGVESGKNAVAVGGAYPFAPSFLRECLSSPTMTRSSNPLIEPDRFPHHQFPGHQHHKQHRRNRHPPIISDPTEYAIPS